MMSRERDKLEKALGGIKDMGGVPDLIFVIDTNKEQLAIKEAEVGWHPGRRDRRHQLRPGRHHLPDPGNDDASRAITSVLRSCRPRRHRRHLAQPGFAGRRRWRFAELRWTEEQAVDTSRPRPSEVQPVDSADEPELDRR